MNPNLSYDENTLARPVAVPINPDLPPEPIKP